MLDNSLILIFVLFSRSFSLVNNGIVFLVFSKKTKSLSLSWTLISAEFLISFASLVIFLFSLLITKVLLNCLSSIGNKYFSESNESLTFATWQSSFADFGKKPLAISHE